ncbi:MAG: DUF523 domain-containing protein [Campylobacterota bacterium]|nr:DUF523 domain-containing protein [Campylobacterota bacterium]
MVISACLLGEICRYDGCAKKDPKIPELYRDWEIVPFCPEATVLGTPRERISVVFKNREYRVIGDESGRDVTEILHQETQKLIDAHPDLDKIILKSKSPSCGIGTTPILKQNKELLCYDNGIAAQMLIEHFSEIEIVDENS